MFLAFTFERKVFSRQNSHRCKTKTLDSLAAFYLNYILLQR